MRFQRGILIARSMLDSHRQTLATAHATLMFLVLSSLGALVYLWPAGGLRSTPTVLVTPAICLQAATLLYLAATAVMELTLAKRLRAGHDLRHLLGLPTLLAHLWVLIVALATGWRGLASRTFLASLHWQLATLVAVSLLALLLLVLTRRLALPAEARQSYRLSDTDYQVRWAGWCQAAMGLLVVFALWYLETRPL